MNWTRLAPCWPKRWWKTRSPCMMGKETYANALIMQPSRKAVGLFLSPPYPGRLVGAPSPTDIVSWLVLLQVL